MHLPSDLRVWLSRRIVSPSRMPHSVDWPSDVRPIWSTHVRTEHCNTILEHLTLVVEMLGRVWDPIALEDGRLDHINGVRWSDVQLQLPCREGVAKEEFDCDPERRYPDVSRHPQAIIQQTYR
jgi:hypothetical protein